MRPSPRLSWIDATRGFCVLAVVLLHFTGFAYSPVVENESYRTFWNDVSHAITPFRMPVLFFISGFLMASRVRQGFTPKTTDAIVRNYYLYALWVLVYALMPLDNGVPSLLASPGEAVIALIYPQSVLWYILALAFWLTILTALRGVPAWLLLPVLAALSLATHWMPGTEGIDQYLRILRYGLYFSMGTLLPEAAQKLDVVKSILLLGFSAGVILVAGSFDLQYGHLASWTIELVTNSAAIIVALTTFFLLSVLAPPVSRGFAWVGKRTMPIFILHAPLIWGLVAMPAWTQILHIRYHSIAAPLLWTVILSVASVAIMRLLDRGPGKLLFAPPVRWLRGPVTGKHVR